MSSHRCSDIYCTLPTGTTSSFPEAYLSARTPFIGTAVGGGRGWDTCNPFILLEENTASQRLEVGMGGFKEAFVLQWLCYD